MITMDIHQILKRLPHRYPFLLVDRVLELETDTVSYTHLTLPTKA